jgi:hypothetical protein
VAEISGQPWQRLGVIGGYKMFVTFFDVGLIPPHTLSTSTMNPLKHHEFPAHVSIGN